MLEVTGFNTLGLARHQTVGTLVSTEKVKHDNFLIVCCSRKNV